MARRCAGAATARRARRRSIWSRPRPGPRGGRCQGERRRRHPGDSGKARPQGGTEETRYFIASAALAPERAAEAIRAHWGIESLHWVLDVIFKEDQSRLRRGYGAQNMALVRRLAFNLVRAGRGKRSIKTARKAAGWNTDFRASLILPKPR